MLFPNSENPVFLAFSGHISSFSFSYSVRFTNEALDLHNFIRPTDQYGNNVTRRVKVVSDVVFAGLRVVGEHVDVEPWFFG